MNCLFCMEDTWHQMFDLSSAKLLPHCCCNTFSEFYGRAKKVPTQTQCKDRSRHAAPGHTQIQQAQLNKHQKNPIYSLYLHWAKYQSSKITTVLCLSHLLLGRRNWTSNMWKGSDVWTNLFWAAGLIFHPETTSRAAAWLQTAQMCAKQRLGSAQSCRQPWWQWEMKIMYYYYTIGSEDQCSGPGGQRGWEEESHYLHRLAAVQETAQLGPEFISTLG